MTTIDIDGLDDVFRATKTPEKQVAQVQPERPRPAAQTHRTTKCGTLFFDFETIPDESRMSLFNLQPLPVLPTPIPFSEMMSPAEFITQTLDVCRTWFKSHHPCDEWVDWVERAEMESGKKPRAGLFDLLTDHREKAQTIADAAADRNKLLSVTPEFNRIVAMGWAIDDNEPLSLIVGPQSNGGEVTERVLVEYFWTLTAMAKRLCGYNVLGFDLPTIFIRSAILRVKPTRKIDLKPWGADVIDLMKLRFPAGQPREDDTGKPSRLKTLARVYGFPIPAGDCDGSQVSELYQSDPQKLAEYVKSDVALCQAMHGFYEGFFFA